MARIRSIKPESLDGLMEVPAVRPEYRHLYTNTPAARCWVYEVWDTQHRLAYVGIADNFERRWRQHCTSSWWLGEIDVWYIDLHGYRTRNEAEQVEAATINEQSPVYNTRLETRAYARYLRLWSDPYRPTDEMDCIPVKKRRFVPAKLKVVL